MAGAKRPVLLLALAAGAILLAAGCGGGGGGTTTGASATTTAASGTTTSAATTSEASSTPLPKAEYVARMKSVGRSLSTSLNTLGSATTAATAAEALTAVQVDLRAAAAKLDGVAPPDAIKKEHAALIKAVRDFADELDPVIAKLRKGNMTALSSVPTLKGLTEIQAASTAITAKGYKIGG